MPKFIYIGGAIDEYTYAPYNIWRSQDATVVSTTTTFIDSNIVGSLDSMANPASGNQPTLNAADPNFNGLDSFSFDGSSDYVYKSINDWRVSDDSGTFFLVFRTGSDLSSNQNIFASSEESGNACKFRIAANSSGLDIYIQRGPSGSANRFTTTTTSLTINTTYVISVSSSGSNYKVTINGTNQSFSFIDGSDDGFWLSSTDNQGRTRVNITIGALIQSIQSYGLFDWAFTGYYPYLNDTKNLKLNTYLSELYGI